MNLSRIIADNDQDEAAGEEWMRESSNEDLLAVWLAIQKPYDDPVNEIISRFAQLKFAEMFVKVRGNQPKGE